MTEAADTELPSPSMRISRLEVRGFRGCPDGSYDFARDGEPRELTVITGLEASGKTSLLEAIVAAKEAVGPYGIPPRMVELRRSGATELRLVATWRLDGNEGETVVRATGSNLAVDAAPTVRARFERYGFEPSHSKMEYFPANRSLVFGGSSEPPAAKGTAHDRLTTSDTKYAWVCRYLASEERAGGLAVARRAIAEGISLGGELDAFRSRVNRHLAAFSPHLRFIGARETSRGAEPAFVRRDGVELLASQLSASEQQAVLLIGAHLHLGLDTSLVLVDEPELHQHPAQHARVLAALQGLGDGHQLIAATSSASLLRTAPAECIIQLG